jgi:hypothetical protein
MRGKVTDEWEGFINTQHSTRFPHSCSQNWAIACAFTASNPKVLG